MDTVTLARWQFGITTVYHFLFVPITIAMSMLVAVLQTMWVKTGKDAYLRLTKFFGKLFLINFAMGVVTGIVQEFQFGMNWSEYSRFVGDIFGAPLALEALLAFFMESVFLGLWIFGWDRLPKHLHLMAIWLAAIGTNLSAIFILAANFAFGILLAGLPSMGIPAMGLIVGIYALTFIASLAGNEFHAKSVFVLATVLAVGSYVAFVWALKLQFPVWPSFIAG